VRSTADQASSVFPPTTADRATAATCAELLNYVDNLWLFVYCKDVEPTNNAAERSLRHAVIWKHLSFGTQSEHGSRFVERLLTVIETCRQQKRNAFDFLADSLTARNARTKPPSTAARGVNGYLMCAGREQ